MSKRKLLVMDCNSSARDFDWLARFAAATTTTQGAADVAANADEHDAVLVFDDGSETGAQAVRDALALREARPNLPVAVLKTLGTQAGENAGIECQTAQLLASPAANGACIDARQAATLMRAGLSQPAFDLHVNDNAICFEYAGE